MEIVASVKPLAAVLSALIGACMVMLSRRSPNVRESWSLVAALVMFPYMVYQYRRYGSILLLRTTVLFSFIQLAISILYMFQLSTEPNSP